MVLEELYAILACVAVLGLVLVVALKSTGVVRLLFNWMVILGLPALVAFTVFTVVS